MFERDELEAGQFGSADSNYHLGSEDLPTGDREDHQHYPVDQEFMDKTKRGDEAMFEDSTARISFDPIFELDDV